MSEVLYTLTDHVAEITINRPAKANALNAAVRTGLFDAFRRANDDPECRVVILTAVGDRHFCSGADLVELAAAAEDGSTLLLKDYVPIVRKNVTLDKPVIAAVNGCALAGGFLMVQMCDLAVASTNASFGITEAKRGRGAPWAVPLTRQLPYRVAMELLITAEPLSAERAHELGFINSLVAPEALMNHARAVARKVAVNAPLSVRAGTPVRCWPITVLMSSRSRRAAAMSRATSALNIVPTWGLSTSASIAANVRSKSISRLTVAWLLSIV